MTMAVDQLTPGPPPPGSVTPQWSIDPTTQAIINAAQKQQATTVANGQTMASSLINMFNSQITSSSNASTTSLSNDGSTVISPGLSNGAIVLPNSQGSTANPISNMLLITTIAIAGFLIYVLGKGHRK